jgi:hypothetical protein
MSKVSVIIPAYNESERILQVLKVLTQVEYLDDIIVIDDGSKDDTVHIVENYRSVDPRIHLISNPKNLGKGQAVFAGVRSAKHAMILMLDADLRNLTPGHIDALCNPVVSGKQEMTIGVFKDGHWASDFSHWITPWLSGQRCLRTELFAQLSGEAAAGYGLETALTIAAQQYQWRVKKIALRGVSHPPSEIHRGSLKGLFNRIKMYTQIFRAWYVATAKKAIETELSEK